MISYDKFIEKYSAPEDSLLYELRRETHNNVLMPRMLSGQTQGKLLEMLSRMLKPKRILEIGTFTGYSALCLAKGLTEDGVLHTVERNDEREVIIRKYIEKSGNTNKIILHIGSAIDVVKHFDEPFDLVFIDGDKREYPDYYKLTAPLVKQGGYMLVDNIFWDGKVLNPEQHADYYTQGILNFLELANNDTRFESVVLPLRDGLMLMRRI